MLNKNDIITEVAGKSGESKAAVERVMDALEELIVNTVVGGEKINLSGFASFAPAKRAARKGHNPKTGEAINIPASTTVKITPSSKFKDAVKSHKK